MEEEASNHLKFIHSEFFLVVKRSFKKSFSFFNTTRISDWLRFLKTNIFLNN